MSRYEVVTVRDPVFGEEAFELQDHRTGSSALVIPRLGNNLMSFVAYLDAGRKLEVILGAPAGTTAENAWRWGNPILFPFPNRVRNGRFTFQERHYQLDPNMPEGHHLHGLVCYRPWRVAEAATTEEGATVRCAIEAEDHPDILRQYPFPFRLDVAYVLRGNTLRCLAEVRNVGSDPMPMGFGLHPSLRAPLDPRGRRQGCRISVPAEAVWQLDADKLPTGEQVPVPAELDFRRPRLLDGVYLDHSYTNLVREQGLAICRLIDPFAQAQVTERFGPEFPELVVLAPADRSTVSFEPYTGVTDAANLAHHRPDTGLIVLEPGEEWRGTVEISAENG